MNMNKKTILMIFSIFVLGIFYFFYKGLTKKIEVPQPNVPSKPAFPKYLSEPIAISTSLSSADFVFPEKMPLVLVQKSPPLTEGEVIVQAERANFSKVNYLITEDVSRGTVYIFRDNSRSLSFYSKTNETVYVSGLELSSKSNSLTDESLIKIAEDFLQETFLLESKSLFFSSIIYLNKNEEHSEVVTRSEANMFKVNFSPIELGIKLVENDPLSSGISVWINKGGDILKAEIKKQTSTVFSTENILIKNYEEFTKTLSSSTLVNLADGNIFPKDLSKGSIKNINVDKVEIAYYKESSEVLFYQPVFVLSGTATVEKLGSIPAILYLPAAKGL